MNERTNKGTNEQTEKGARGYFYFRDVAFSFFLKEYFGIKLFKTQELLINSKVNFLGYRWYEFCARKGSQQIFNDSMDEMWLKGQSFEGHFLLFLRLEFT